MRVIAGKLGGRNFEAPRTNRTHPMSEKIRGAIFNSLGELDGLTVLDAYSGSGALSIEAISRGATRVTAIEVDTQAFKTIRSNIMELGLTNDINAIRANIHGWSSKNAEVTFDIVLCDPPYDEVHATNIQKLLRHVRSGGLLILSWPGHVERPVFPDTDEINYKPFGDAKLIYYRKH